MLFKPAWRIALLLLIPTLPVFGDDPVSQIRRKIASVQESAKGAPAADADFGNLRGAINEQIKEASGALDSGRLYLSLEALGRAVNLLRGAQLLTDKKADVVKGGLAAYEPESRRITLGIEKAENEARAKDWSDAPAVVRALAESVQARSRALADGARGLAMSVAPKDALFSLGQAEGEAEFVQFCASLQFPRQAREAPQRTLAGELENLQRKTNAAFVPPRSIQAHSQFIVLNSTLMLGQKLDTARFYAGALYQYLDAVLAYGMLTGAAPDESGKTALKAAIDATQKKLENSGRDDSIAMLFVERSTVLNDGKANDWKAAQVIVDQVLPAYAAALEAAPIARQVSGKTVDVTLVR